MPDPCLTFQWEQLAKLLDEDGLAETVKRHHVEVGVDQDTVPLVIDWNAYLHKQAVGLWRPFTMRRDGVLAGYIAFHFHRPDRYQDTLFIQEDTIFIIETNPRVRGLLWLRLWKEARDRMPRPCKLQGKVREDRLLPLVERQVGLRKIESVVSMMLL